MCSNCNKYVYELKKREKSQLPVESRSPRLGGVTPDTLQPEMSEARSRWLWPAVRRWGRSSGASGRGAGAERAVGEGVEGGASGFVRGARWGRRRQEMRRRPERSVLVLARNEIFPKSAKQILAPNACKRVVNPLELVTCMDQILYR
jgi:hypothetical protein